MTTIVLIGAGGHCRSCIDVVEQTGQYRIVGLVDSPERKGQCELGYPIIACDADLPHLVPSCETFLITLGHLRDPSRRMELYNLLVSMGAKLATVVSPLAHVSRHANVGAGTVIMHGAIVNAGASVGCNCILNTMAVVEHDAQIGDHCHISTGAIVNGGVVVGARTFIGSQAVTKQGIVIPPGSFIKAGSLVKA